MPAVPQSFARQPAPRPGKRYFTLAEARRALPLVKKIAFDVQATQALRVMLHQQMNSGGVGGGGGTGALTSRELELLEARFEKATDKIEGLIAELVQVGVELKDASTGLLDFPAVFQGREILLCWKGGEETITHWHEVDGGFAGRKPVEMLGA